MKTPLISIEKASIGYPNLPVLTNVSININAGEHWAFVGVSGAGKTTLLQAIAGNLQLRAGSIARNLTEQGNVAADYHKDIAFVTARHQFRNLSNVKTDFYYQQRFNSTDSEDALTVDDYLSTTVQQNPPAHGWTLDKAVNLLMLAPLRNKQLIKLSNGETRRLMIAAALLKNPLLLLLDNPLAGLDAQTRKLFDTVIDTIAASGITIVMATSPGEIPAVIERVGLLQAGALSEVPKSDLKGMFTSPISENTFTADISPLLDKYPVPTYNNVVSMKGVTIRYGDKVILDNISWQIKQGERWALMGRNGAGKSTLLSLINGDNPQAYANNIVLFDKKRGTGESIWDIKKKTGFISPELFQYFPSESTCLQAIESGYYDTVGLFRQSSPALADRAMQWLKLLGIESHSRHLLKNIPAGAQRLTLLARAMVKNPALLILDEPCQGLDNRQTEYFKTLIDAICQASNITLIYVTHYAEQIPNSVTKTLTLENGLVVM